MSQKQIKIKLATLSNSGKNNNKKTSSLRLLPLMIIFNISLRMIISKE